MHMYTTVQQMVLIVLHIVKFLKWINMQKEIKSVRCVMQAMCVRCGLMEPNNSS